MSGKSTTRVLDSEGKETKKGYPNPCSATQALIEFWEFAGRNETIMRVTYASDNKVVYILNWPAGNDEPAETTETTFTWNKDGKDSLEREDFLASVKCWVMTHPSQCEKSVIDFFKK